VAGALLHLASDFFCAAFDLISKLVGKRLISASMSKYRGRASDDNDGNSPPMPRAPAYSRPLASSRTDIDMSVSWVAMPNSANSRHSVG